MARDTVLHVATQDNKRGWPREGSAFGGSMQQAAASNAANAGRAACVQGATQPSGATGGASRHAVWIQMTSRARHGGSWPAHIHTHAHMHTHTPSHSHTHAHTHLHTHTHTCTAAQACSDARAGLAHVPYGDVLHSSSPDQLCRQVPVLTGTQTQHTHRCTNGNRRERSS